MTHKEDFLPASRRSTAPALARTKAASAGVPRRSPPEGTGGAVASPRPKRPSLARILRDSRLRAGEILPAQRRQFVERRKFLPTDAIRADLVLEILGFRGWENAASAPQRGTAWAPSTESLGFLALRPAKGEEIFSSLRQTSLASWRFCILLLGLILLSGFSLKREEPAFEILGGIPVQSGGRVKPFESFAREALLSVMGKFSFEAKSATAVVWEWIARPEEWHTKSFLPLRFKPFREEFGLMVIGEKISPELVLTHPPFQEKVRKALEKQEKKEPVGLADKKRLELYERARLFQAVAQGSIPGFLPAPRDPRAGWTSLAGLGDLERRAVLEREYSPSRVAEIQGALARLLKVIREGEKVQLLERANAFQHSLEDLFDSRGIALDQFRLGVERTYHRIRPFHWAWILYLASALLGFLLRGRFQVLPLVFFGAGFLAHSLGFVLRSLIAGRPPVSNMYESVIWVAWAAVFFSTILGLVYRKSIFLAVAAGVAAFSLLIGESFPAVLDPSLSPLVPVLRNNYWLTVHVLTITLSYGAFALAWGLAHALLLVFAFRSKEKEGQEMLSQYLYRVLQIGVVLLAAGTILGGVWANDSWGRFWGWDPKETWALIALFGYLAVLHGRFAGWLGPFGTAVGSVLAFLGILMAWYGVNFVLAAGFHSYGFGGGGLPYILAAVGLDLAFVSFLTFRYNKVR